MKRIGEYYGESNARRVEHVDYHGGTMKVIQNEWDDELQVTQNMPQIGDIESSEELRRVLHEAMTKMAVLESLGYDLMYCDEGVAFWSKDLSE